MKILDIFSKLGIDGYDMLFYDAICKIVVASGEDANCLMSILYDVSEAMKFEMEAEDNNEICTIKIPKCVLDQEIPEKIEDQIENDIQSFKSYIQSVDNASDISKKHSGVWIIDNLEFEYVCERAQENNFDLRLIHNPSKLSIKEILDMLHDMHIDAKLSYADDEYEFRLKPKKNPEPIFTFNKHTISDMMGRRSPNVNLLEAFLRYKKAKDFKIISKLIISDIIPIRIYEQAKCIFPYSIDIEQVQLVANERKGIPSNRVIVLSHTNGDMACFLQNGFSKINPNLDPWRSTWDIGFNNYNTGNEFESYIKLLTQQTDLHVLCDILQNNRKGGVYHKK